MARKDWLVGDRGSEGSERIYAAATDLIAAGGFDAFGMDALQDRVHCSRATIYRHVGGKTQIRDAVLARGAERIIAGVRAAVDGLSGTERTVTAVVVALERIRTDPLGRLLVTSVRAGREMRWVGESDTPRALAAELTGTTDDPLAAQWIVRIVLSLLVWPVENPAVEREMIERFVAT